MLLSLAGCSADRPAPPADKAPPAATSVVVLDSPAAAARLAALRAVFARELEPATEVRFERREALHAVLAGHDGGRPPSHLATVELPEAASGAVRVTDAASGLGASFRLIGAGDAAPEIAAGLVVYAGAAPGGGDLVHRISAAGVEDYAVFARPPAAPELRYRADVRGVAGLRFVAGTLELLDARGAPRLRVTPPFLVDAAGKRRAAALAVEGCAFDTSPRAPWGRTPTAPGADACTVVVRFDPAGLTYPILVDPQWVSTKVSMATARTGHTVTLFDPGDPESLALVAGGFDGSGVAIPSAELYEPLGRTFAATSAMTAARGAHTATRLAEGPAPILIAGGAGAGGAPLASTEIYDPATGKFTPDLTMSSPRRAHSATRFADGQVLIAGGFGSSSNQSLKSADLYTASPKSLVPTGSMGSARAAHADVLLDSGGVLVTGGLSTGFAQQSAEIYTPAAGTFAPVAATGGALPQMTAPRAHHTATKLDGGAVLLAGGANDANDTIVWDTAELYLDGAAKRGFVQPVVPMIARRTGHTASLLPTGSVLLAGGSDGSTTLASAEHYDPSSSTFTAFAGLITARRGHAAAVVNAGGSTIAGRGVLITGGTGVTGAALASAEVAIRPLGDDCAIDGDCASGHCVDGRCCDQPCKEPCRACSAAGICGFADYGTDAGTYCVNDTEVHQACGDAGKPVPLDTIPCKPNTCTADGTVCQTYCTATLPCSKDGWCTDAGADDAGIPEDAGPGAGLCVKKGDVAAPCTDDGQCLSGHCVDGVCCDQPCTNPCEACDVVGATGFCKVVGAKDKKEQPHNKPACAGEGDCQGFCLGAADGQCAFPDVGAPCGDASCACEGEDCAAAKLTSLVCDGTHACGTQVTDCPDGLRCGDTGCKSGCETDDDCIVDYVCNPQTQKCEALTGPRCDGQHSLKIPMSAAQDCTPYRCNGSACLTQCKSVDDCVAPNVCDTSGKCVKQLSAPVITSCAASPTGATGRGIWAGFAGVLALAWMQRRRMRRR